jgi:Uma2 family endonuclease
MIATIVSAAASAAQPARETTVETAIEVEHKVILRNISWSLYQELQAAKGDTSNPRFAYDRGILEITMPSPEHEIASYALARIFENIAEELDIDYANLGSTTFDRKDLEKALEPDACFYVEQADLMRDKKRMDPLTDPPPELVIEVDVSSSSLNKLPIYAGLGVREIWRWRHSGVVILLLEDDGYHEQDSSAILPGVTTELLTYLLQASRQMKRKAWRQEVRAVAQAFMK